MSLKQLARRSAATLALSIAAATAHAAYTPTGVQNDVDYNSVLNGGWSVAYQGAYGGNFSIASVFDSIAAGSKVMLAAKNVASSVFDVLAWATKEDVLQYTAQHQTHEANGALWYFNGGSMGFAGLGDAIYQTSADVEGSGDFVDVTQSDVAERDRLSWHTSGGYNAVASDVNGGWRSGSNIWLNGAQDWERFVLVFDENVAPVPEPETYGMLLAGLGLITLAARRRKAQLAA